MAKSKVGINLQLPADVYNDFKALCNFNENSMTQTTIDLIHAYLEQNKKIVDALNAQKKLFDDAMNKVVGSDSSSVVKDVFANVKGAGK